jgi:2-keto-4-pentenoate hydratase
LNPSVRIEDPTQLPPIERWEDVYDVHKHMSSISSTLGSHCGWKCGACTTAGQESFGLPGEPFCAPLFEKTLKPTNSPIDLTRNVLIVEAEFAFYFGKGLPPKGANYTTAEIWDAVGAVAVCIEVVGSRLVGEAFANASPMQRVSDDGLNIECIVGTSVPVSSCRRDLENVAVKFLVNDKVVAEGSGANVLGSPANSLAWLANKLNKLQVSSADSQYGSDGVPGIREGDFIMSGAATVLAGGEVAPGDKLTAQFEGMGEVVGHCS